MKKRVFVLSIIFLFMLVLFSISFALAASDNASSSDKAYSCLAGKVKGQCSSLTAEEQSFSILALSDNSAIQSECTSALHTGSYNSGQCWPKSGCTLRDTALATIALQYIGASSNEPESWLISQNKTADDLTWYLEMDASDASVCKISYDNSNYNVNMGADKKLNSNAGSCLTLANSNYWLQISSSCLNKNFTVSCDKDFSTALLYKKSGSDTWYVSSQTKSASAKGLTQNQVNSLCLKQGSSCNYEGTLWGVLALSKNHDIKPYLPYLIALAPDNTKYNPDAFLYMLTTSDENLINIGNSQFTDGHWDFSSGYTKFYDTALSLFALQTLNNDNADNARNWLIDNEGTNGCWQDSVKLTAFILFAGWPKTPVPGGGGTVTYCEQSGKSCLSQVECSNAGGSVLSDYFCAQSGEICCSNSAVQQTCLQKGGQKCSSDKQCSISTVSSSDEPACCTGSCEQIPQQSDCEKQNYICRASCLSGEQAQSLSCTYSSDLCCSSQPAPKSYWWLWLLIILIILAALAIIFRNQLRLWFFKFKNKFGKSGVQQTRPPFPPSSSGMQRPMPRMMPQPNRMISGLKTKADAELEDTLRKLREMSK